MVIEGGRDEMAVAQHARLLTETADRESTADAPFRAGPRAGFYARFGLLSSMTSSHQAG
jgi:hypothetical protein